MQITESLKGNFSPTIYEHCFVFGFSYSSLNVRKLFLFFFFFMKRVSVNRDVTSQINSILMPNIRL